MTAAISAYTSNAVIHSSIAAPPRRLPRGATYGTGTVVANGTVPSNNFLVGAQTVPCKSREYQAMPVSRRTFRIDDDTWDRVQQDAGRQGITTSAYVREAIMAMLSWNTAARMAKAGIPLQMPPEGPERDEWVRRVAELEL